jgi:hypothetical protein
MATDDKPAELRDELMADRKLCSEPESAPADAPRPTVARATTIIKDSQLRFPGI